MKKMLIIGGLTILICLGIIYFHEFHEIEKNNYVNEKIQNIWNYESSIQIEIPTEKTEETFKNEDWKLTLVNYENTLPEDFSVKLSYIDSTRQFDTRAIDFLNQMLGDLKKSGIFNVWVQSAYRSVSEQRSLFYDKIDTYRKQGKTKEEAENLTLKTINQPGTSEHNLGLAVDFNYVNYDFDQTKGFQWLQKNAQNYGFILRYPKEKETITKVNYEPWHWRYVGIEHAERMKELGMCLEEYVAEYYK